MMPRRVSGVTVSGPGVEPRSAQNLIAGVGVAQRFAERADRAATFYVRDGDQSVYWIERTENGVVVTRPATNTTEGGR